MSFGGYGAAAFVASSAFTRLQVLKTTSKTTVMRGWRYEINWISSSVAGVNAIRSKGREIAIAERDKAGTKREVISKPYFAGLWL